MTLTPTQRRRRITRITGRVVIASLAVGLFVAVASVFEPENSTATPQRVVVEFDVNSRSDATYLGELVGKDHSVIIHATAEGPRYTAIDGLGNVIATDLQVHEVYRYLPDANLETISADDNGLLDTPLLLDDALMLADYD
ncbi:MAG: hypothetical protein ACYTF7_08465 [Planctomycetota bacterium]|jgi:hypothetical protein